jgi:hypothetical protein
MGCDVDNLGFDNLVPLRIRDSGDEECFMNLSQCSDRNIVYLHSGSEVQVLHMTHCGSTECV